ncbi:adenylate kinase [[Eubacterium] cellulosolvens]
MGSTVIITGSPGVGKTSVLNKLAKEAEKEKIALKIVNFGTTMNKLLESYGKNVHRDELRKQNFEKQKEIQLEAAKEISKMKNHYVLVVDTHMFIRTPVGAFPGLPECVIKELDPSMLVLLEANPEDITKRREKDQTRKRDTQTDQTVEFDLEWGRKTAAACAIITGAPVSIVRNEEGFPDKAVKQILNMIKEVI